MERRLADVARTTPAFAAALRAYRKATLDGDQATAQSLLAWIGGQPNVAAAARRAAGVKGNLDHFAAMGFLQGLLTVLRDSGHPGLLLVLDETETLQRVRSDVRDKALNALRQLVDDVDSGRFPGLYLLITGTPAFYDGPQGVSRLTPLAQRLATDFGTDPRFDSPRAVQVRLTGFDLPKLVKLGIAIRDVYASGQDNAELITVRADDTYIADLAKAVAGELGGQAGVAPRVFLRKLVADILDRVAEFDDFDPRQHYSLTLSAAELTDTERNAAAVLPRTADDVELDI
jgi:bacteriophage exclusion system BrxC/D-like protein